MQDSSDKFWITALICGTLWFSSDLIIDGAVPFYRDLTNYFYPLRYSLYESLRRGEIPLWDSHFAQGFPNFAAFQIGTFYPPHWALVLLPFFTAIRALFVFHFLVAALGTYVLLREWRYSGVLAFAGAVLFAFGGAIISLSNLLNHFQSAVWLPWIILAWERLLITPCWGRFVFFTGMSSVQLLAGSPEISVLSSGLAMLHGFQLRAGAPQLTWARIGGLALAANFLMLALLMAQLLPMFELILQSRRGHSIPAQEAMMWSLNPLSLMNLFFLDKEVDFQSWLGVRLFFGRDTPFLISNYLGAISLFGITVWAAYSSRREKLFLAALVLLSLALALGSNALIYPFLYRHFSILSAIRFPEKYFFLTHMFFLLITFRGLRVLMSEQTGGLRKPVILLGSVCFFWLTLYGLLLYRSEIVSDFIATHSSIPPITDLHVNATASVLSNLQRQLILTGALACIVLLVKANKLRPVLFSVLFASIVFFDLTSAHKGFLFPIQPERLYKTTPVIQASVTKLTRFFFYPAPHNLHPALFTVQGRPKFADAVGLSFQNFLPNVGVIEGLDYFQEIDAFGRRPYSEFLAFANNLELELQLKLLGTFNVKYLVSFRELPERGIRLVGRFPQYFSWLYEIPSVVPRVYMVDQVLVETEPGRVLPRLAAVDFDARKQVILDTVVPLRRQSNDFVAAAELQRYDNHWVTITTKANGDGILVLADSFYPGWRAYVDGKETTIYRTNHFYRGVALPKGTHQVEFKYEPQSFKLGVIISVFTGMSILVVSLCRLTGRRKSKFHNCLRVDEVLQNS